MKVTVNGFISIQKADWLIGDFKYNLGWFHSGAEKFLSEGEFKLCDYDIEIEAPDNLDELIRNKTLKALQEKRKVTLAENQERINEIDRQISELLAIENKAE